jgi:type VI secretion system protein ImpE
MVASKDLISAGKIAEAREQLSQEVKSAPADSGKRILLAQVLTLTGELERAEQHLDATVTENPTSEIAIQGYKNLLQAERERIEVARNARRPLFIGQSPPYLELHFEAWDKLNRKELKEATSLFRQIKHATALKGTLNGTPFRGLRDTDTFLSFFLEAFLRDQYFWIPFEMVKELTMSGPKTLMDLIWMPAKVITREDVTLGCHLPVLYPESFRHSDDRVKMGRVTDWTPLGNQFTKGAGQHVYQLGKNEIPLLEIRELKIQSPKSR